MCRIEEIKYVDADGRQHTAEDSYPCHKARSGRLCSSVTKKTIQYPSEPLLVSHGDSSSPSPNDPPTPTSSGPYKFTERKPPSTGRPSTRDGNTRAIKPEIIIEFGKTKESKKAYHGASSRNYKPSSLRELSHSSDDVAVDYPESDASDTIRTGFPEASILTTSSPPYTAEIADRVAEAARRRQARSEHDRRQRQMEADRQMADAIQKDEEANQVRFEVGRAEYPGKERAENLYAQHEKRRAEEREESRRTRQQEEKERAKKGAARDSKRKAERGKEELGRKEREVKIAERAAPSKRYSRRLSMSQEQIAEYERALAETDAQLQRERAAVEQRERDERATLLVEQQKTTGYYSTRCPPPTTYTIVDEGPVDDRHSSIDRTNNVYRDYPLIAFGRSNQRKVPIVQHKAPNPWDNYHTWEQERLRARTHLERKEGASERGLLRGVETVRRPTPRSGDARRSTPTSPATNSVREQPLLSNQSRQLSVSPFTQLDEVDTHFQDMLGDDINSEGIKHAIDSLEPHKSLSSVDNMRDVTGKAPELPKQLLPNSVSPIILPHTESILANNQLLDMQDVPDDMGEYDTSKPRESIATSSTSSSVTVPLPVQNHPTPGKDHNGDDPETGRHTELVESSRGAEKLVRISQPERMEQVELSLLPSNISTEVADCTTRDDYLNINPGINVVKELTILSKPNKSDMPEVSTFVDSLSTSDRSGCQLENCCDSSTSAAEEEIDSFFETGEESDGASEKCEAGVKSALDTAMNVVKSLLLRELLDCALPQATDTPEELGSSGSGSHTGSASSAASSSHSSRTSGSQTPQRRKRTRSNGRDPGDEDGDDSEDDDRPKKKNEKGSPDRLPHRRLKCPFYQRQPEKYKKAACRGEGFVDMAKLKDHIKRVHMQPLRCSRCWMEMESEDAYSEHLQQEDSCKRKAEPQEDRIRPQVLKRLNFKKAPYTNARNVEEKWNMLFLVLFPDDTSIPSPYDQQGMSPRLEKALSEAIEEELTRELAPILGPIMSRIKKLIPSIIESCRLKLRCTSPSSDEETIFTPPAVSSGGGSSDNETKSSDKQTEYRGCAVVSRCSGSSFEIVPIPEDHSSKAQGKQSRPVASSKNDMSIAGQQVDSPPMSGTDFGVFNSDTLREIPNNCGINIEDYLNIGYESDLFALPGEFPIDSALPATEGSVHCPMSTADMAFETFDFIDNSPQKINACLPESQLPAWSFPGSGWDGGPQRVLGSEQQGGPVPREQEPHPGENPL